MVRSIVWMSRRQSPSSASRPGRCASLRIPAPWQVVRLDDVPFTIVGIAEPRFHGTSVERVGIWIPLSALPALRPQSVFDPARLGTRSVDVRLAPQKSLEEASAELNLLHVQYRQTGRTAPVNRPAARGSWFDGPL